MLIGLPCAFVLNFSGEFYNEDDFRPLGQNQLLGLAYSEINGIYKLDMADKFFHPDVIALGSSRILQVKERIINQHYSFYNAGGAIANIYQYRMFLDRLHIHPKLFIINIDQWLFNPNYANQRATLDKDCYQFPQRYFTAQSLSLITDAIKGKIDFEKLFDTNNPHIGINARINQNGFSHDGSYHYGQLLANPTSSEDYNFKDTFRRIEEGDRNFQYCNTADTTVIEALDSFLVECARHDISVLALLPPFAPTICKRMEASGKYDYLQQIYKPLFHCFNKYPHCFIYDYTDMTALNVHDHEFFDGFHGAESVYNTLIQDIIMKNKEMKRFFVTTHAIDSINNQFYLSHPHLH